MMEHEHAKSFVNHVFEESKKEKEEKEEYYFYRPFDLTAGVEVNYERFIEFPVPIEFSKAYNTRLRDTQRSTEIQDSLYVKKVLNIFLNLERHLSKFILDYYGQKQFSFFEDTFKQVSEMYQMNATTLVFNDFSLRQMNDQIGLLPCSDIFVKTLTNHGKDHMTRREFTLRFFMQDYMYMILHNIHDIGLRTDMTMLSQMTYQFDLLAKATAEVLLKLNLEYHPSD